MTEEPLGEQRQRIDKWLFFTRLVKSRALAQALIHHGSVCINGQVVQQSSRMVKVGDRIDLALETGDKCVLVRAPGDRRGPFSEAALLYIDQSEPHERMTAFERAQRLIKPPR